ncbi:MAG: DUF2703 domain-containing protein [Actinobacteria bacterium]|nr:DUF2703 domain-containing protein [Actinomycetota bacterium]
MKKIIIRWFRLVENGETCPRCAETEKELEDAYKALKESLSAVNINLELIKEEITKEDFEKNPLKSNLLTINGKSLEHWLGGKSGSSKCCSVCGDKECRTVEIDGKTYETIKSELITKAVLIAASDLLKERPRQRKCCKKVSSSCCC